MSSIKREPTAQELEKIRRVIAAGNRIGATSVYISITECGLTEAQFIKALTTELHSANPEKFAQQQKETPLLIVEGQGSFFHQFPWQSLERQSRTTLSFAASMKRCGARPVILPVTIPIIWDEVLVLNARHCMLCILAKIL